MYNPYVKGRWYRIFIESDGTDKKIIESDIEVTFSGNNIKMPEGFHVIDRTYDINCVEHDAATSIAMDVMSYADGTQGIVGPAAKVFDWAYIYVFGYFK